MRKRVNEKASSSRGLFGRIAGAIRAFFASAPVPEFGRMSIRDFLASGEAFLEARKIDPDAWVMNKAIVDAIIEHDPSVDLDKSVIILWDTTMWVDLGSVPRPWATEPSIDVIGRRPYSIGSSMYPTGISICPLYPEATDPKLRYGKNMGVIDYHAESAKSDAATFRAHTMRVMRELLAKFDAAGGGEDAPS